MRHVLPSAAVVALLLPAVPASADPIVFTQAAQSPVVSTRASQDQDTPGLVFQTFDRFTLGENTEITAVSWQGSYFNTFATDPAFAPPANSSGFTVAFYADNAGTPGALLDSHTFSSSSAGETFVGQQPFTPTWGLSIYNYSVSLASLPFVATGGAAYWLSVYALSPDASPTEAQWGWNGGTGGDGVSVQSVFGVPGVVNFDRAFTLEGLPASVPEPSTLMLLGTAAGVFLARGRRRGRTTDQ